MQYEMEQFENDKQDPIQVPVVIYWMRFPVQKTGFHSSCSFIHTSGVLRLKFFVKQRTKRKRTKI